MLHVSVSFHSKNMAPAVGLGHAATALSLLALGLNLETRFRAGELPTAPLSEPEPDSDIQLTLGRLEGKLGQLEGSVAVLGERTARCETLLEPLEERKPEQSTPSAGGATNATERSIDKNATVNMMADELARSKLGPGSAPNLLGMDNATGDSIGGSATTNMTGSVQNLASIDFITRMQQMQTRAGTETVTVAGRPRHKLQQKRKRRPRLRLQRWRKLRPRHKLQR